MALLLALFSEVRALTALANIARVFRRLLGKSHCAINSRGANTRPKFISTVGVLGSTVHCARLSLFSGASCPVMLGALLHYR